MTVRYFSPENTCIHISLKRKRNTKLLLYQVLHFQKVNNFTTFRPKNIYNFRTLTFLLTFPKGHFSCGSATFITAYIAGF
jgi:hypothetical protein